MATKELKPEERKEVLIDLDAFIAKCKDPETPYYADPDHQGIYLNVLQVREHIRQQTTLGVDAAFSWRIMKMFEKLQEAVKQKNEKEQNKYKEIIKDLFHRSGGHDLGNNFFDTP